MTPANRKQAMIVKSLAFAEAYRQLEDERQRDTRPGRFAVTGQFIQLPEQETSDQTPHGPQRNSP